jgi:hypothetical protein
MRNEINSNKVTIFNNKNINIKSKEKDIINNRYII